jgi:xylulokinase
MLNTIKQVIISSKIDSEKVKGIGISGQQHGFVPLDSEGVVIRPAKLWNDTSTFEECSFLIKKLGGENEVIKLIGNTIPPGFTASKILWMKNHEPENFSKLDCVLLPHDYLNYILTGNQTMEYGDASGTALMDIKNRKWCKKVVDAIDLELTQKLPEINPSDTPVGYLKKEIGQEFGIKEALVSAGGGDNMMGAIGTGNTSPGKITVSLGTSGTIYAYSTQPVIDPKGEVAAFCDSTNAWLPLVCTMNVTVATELVRNLFKIDHMELEEMVKKSPAGSKGLLLLPYFTGERVPNIPKGKGLLYGLTPQNFRVEYIARSTVEGVTMGLNYGLDIMKMLGVKPEEIRLTGGGSKNRTWRQIAADIFDAQVVTLKEEEGAAYGAALQAIWTYRQSLGEKIGINEITDKLVELDETSRIDPIKENVEIYNKLQSRQNKLSKKIRDFFES